MGISFDDLSDLRRAASAPFTSAGGHRVFALDTSDDSIILAVGTHEVFNAGSELAYIRLGAATAVPSDKAAETSGQAVIPGGGALTVAVAEATDLHAKTGSSTTTLHIVRKGAL